VAIDISKCTGKSMHTGRGCPLKKTCYHFLAESSEAQSYIIGVYIDGKCEHYQKVVVVKKRRKNEKKV
jgi:hypothetical protein